MSNLRELLGSAPWPLRSRLRLVTYHYPSIVWISAIRESVLLRFRRCRGKCKERSPGGRGSTGGNCSLVIGCGCRAPTNTCLTSTGITKSMFFHPLSEKMLAGMFIRKEKGTYHPFQNHYNDYTHETIIFKLFRDYNYSFQGSPELICIMVAFPLFFNENAVPGNNFPQVFPRIIGNCSYVI